MLSLLDHCITGLFVTLTINPLSPNIHVQILQTDLHRFS